MDPINILIGTVVGAAFAGWLVFYLVKKQSEGKISEILGSKDLEIKMVKQRFDELTRQLDQQSSEYDLHIEQSVQTISATVDDSANSADITSTNLTKIQAQIEDLTEMVENIIQLSDSASEVSETGSLKINDVVNGLAGLANSKDDLALILSRFKEVQEKTVAIRYIGEEAELLALNAAIEAARAGDAGRGFAVVATAMKNLAKSSQNTTFEILDIVNHSEEVITQVADSFNVRGETLSDSIKDLVTNFDQINNSVNSIQDHSKSITHDSNGISSMMREAAGVTNTAAETMLSKLSGLISELTGQSITNISAPDARKQWSMFDEVIDVRKAEELNGDLGSIDGVRLSTLQTSFKQEVKQLDHLKSYLFICRSGGRSTKAAQTALANGVKQVYNLDGGMLEWRRCFPIA